MDPMIDFADYEPLIFYVLRRKRRRIPASRWRDSEEYAECCLTFLKCRREFDPARGVKFSTYFTAALWTDMLRDWKASQRRSRLSYDSNMDARAAPARSADAAEWLELLQARIESRHWEYLVAIRDEIKTGAQARRLGMCREAVRQRRRAALQRARQIIEEAQ
jgi:hypothetical protein